MSFPLFKLNIRKNGLLLIIFASILTMYSAIMIAMFDPKNIASMAKLMEIMPPAIIDAFGMGTPYQDLTGYLASYLYGLLMFGFPLVYSIILGNRLVSKMVDNGSMAYLLSTPTSRSTIIFTNGIYGFSSLLLMFIWVFVFSTSLCTVLFPNALNIASFFYLNLITLLCNMAIFSIIYLCSCLFSDTSKAVAFGSGIPILFLLFNMLGGTSSQLAFLKNMSLYGLYNPVALAGGAHATWQLVLYLGLALGLFILSIIIFKRKRLAL